MNQKQSDVNRICASRQRDAVRNTVIGDNGACQVASWH
jgi:hypothetical protein